MVSLDDVREQMVVVLGDAYYADSHKTQSEDRGPNPPSLAKVVDSYKRLIKLLEELPIPNGRKKVKLLKAINECNSDIDSAEARNMILHFKAAVIIESVFRVLKKIREILEIKV